MRTHFLLIPPRLSTLRSAFLLSLKGGRALAGCAEMRKQALEKRRTTIELQAAGFLI
jgi:hypothetical protein